MLAKGKLCVCLLLLLFFMHLCQKINDSAPVGKTQLNLLKIEIYCLIRLMNVFSLTVNGDGSDFRRSSNIRFRIKIECFAYQHLLLYCFFF